MSVKTAEQYEEQIFELHSTINHLRGQITYLQEQLAQEEDFRARDVNRLENRVEEVEIQLGEALNRYGD